MKGRVWWGISVLLVALFAIAGAFATSALKRPSSELLSGASLKAAAVPTLILTGSQSRVPPNVSEPSTDDGSQSNVLEIREASLDFVGEWGGYTHSTIRSTVPGYLTGKNPDRVSVVFLRQDDTVFIADELYSWPHQRITGKPRVRTANPKEVVIEYESEDARLYYVYTNRFTLRDSGTIAYQETVDVYDRSTENLVGNVYQRSTLKRLRTADEQRRFARPSADELSRSAIAAPTKLAPSMLERPRLSP